MEPITVGLLGLVLMVVLIFLGVPIAVSLGAVGLIGNAVLTGVARSGTQLQLVVWEMATNFLLITIPLFVFMGQLAFQTGIARDMFAAVYRWFGWIPGGLAVATTVSSAAFGAVTGSSVAATAAMGSMVMPEMRRYGYDLKLATGSIASAGTLAILIPPSIPMIIYGVWTETSIPKLFIAGIGPGILMCALFCALIVGISVLHPERTPRGPASSWKERLSALPGVLPIGVVFALVLGGIYGGVVTATEAAAFGCIAVSVVAMVMRRFTWGAFRRAALQSTAISAVLILVIVGGVLVSRFLVLTGLVPAFVKVVNAMALDRYVIVTGFVVMYLILGCVLEAFGMLVLTLPFVTPIMVAFGFDKVWLGIFVTVMVELALITPPVGLNVYVMHSVAPDVPLVTIFRGAAPFVVVALVGVAILTAFPAIALWLPGQMLR
jgi:tripartite ATP-independent transporter DctM subunit